MPAFGLAYLFREDELFTIYRHNGEDSHGEQIYRSAKNTAKTRLLRESLFNLLGNDKTISFCYRQGNELDDATIALSLRCSEKNF